jgi:chorismate dehydratase
VAVDATHRTSSSQAYRLGVVSFLNARPLIAGLPGDERMELLYDVPARLPGWLDEDRVDAALVPIVDVLRSGGRYRVVSDACIGCERETMTVRIFSQAPPERIRVLWVDGDSHTSAALATVLWRTIYGRNIELRRFDARRENLGGLKAVLLIGDKVVEAAQSGFAYEMDLGSAWRLHTGLPFVFAVWAYRSESGTAGGPRRDLDELAPLLTAARDRGVAEASRIAAVQGPELGWPVELARDYLTRCLKFKLEAPGIAGANLFGRLCAEADIVPAEARIAWPHYLPAPES